MGTCSVRKGLSCLPRFYVAVFKDNVKFLYDSGYIFILKGFSFIIRQSIKIPVVLDALFYLFVKTEFSIAQFFLFCAKLRRKKTIKARIICF